MILIWYSLNRDKKYIFPYDFTHQLFTHMHPEDIVWRLLTIHTGGLYPVSCIEICGAKKHHLYQNHHRSFNGDNRFG